MCCWIGLKNPLKKKLQVFWYLGIKMSFELSFIWNGSLTAFEQCIFEACFDLRISKSYSSIWAIIICENNSNEYKI